MLQFLHHHPLEEIQSSILEYLCDGPGVSTRYRCNFCDFDLLECRAISGPTLASFLHPQHKLSLMVLMSNSNTIPPCHICNFCGDEIEGLFYRCSICDFDIHPECTQLPEYINYHEHSIHPLRLQSGRRPVGLCNTCYGVCTSWRYKCGTCGFNIHLGCMSAPPSSPPPPIPSPFYAGVGILPSGDVGIGVTAANYAVYNNNPQQSANAKSASSSSGAVPPKGKSEFGKKVGLFVGRMAIGIALGALGIPDISSLFWALLRCSTWKEFVTYAPCSINKVSLCW